MTHNPVWQDRVFRPVYKGPGRGRLERWKSLDRHDMFRWGATKQDRRSKEIGSDRRGNGGDVWGRYGRIWRARIAV